MAIDILIYLSLKYDGDTNKIKEAVEKEEMFTRFEYNTMIRNQQYKCVDFMDYYYPQELKYLEDKPFTMFYYGDLRLLYEKDTDQKFYVSDKGNYGIAVTKTYIDSNNKPIFNYLLMDQCPSELDEIVLELKREGIEPEHPQRLKNKERSR